MEIIISILFVILAISSIVNLRHCNLLDAYLIGHSNAERIGRSICITQWCNVIVGCCIGVLLGYVITIKLECPKENKQDADLGLQMDTIQNRLIRELVEFNNKLVENQNALMEYFKTGKEK